MDFLEAGFRAKYERVCVGNLAAEDEDVFFEGLLCEEGLGEFFFFGFLESFDCFVFFLLFFTFFYSFLLPLFFPFFSSFFLFSIGRARFR